MAEKSVTVHGHIPIAQNLLVAKTESGEIVLNFVSAGGQNYPLLIDSQSRSKILAAIYEALAKEAGIATDALQGDKPRVSVGVAIEITDVRAGIEPHGGKVVIQFADRSGTAHLFSLSPQASRRLREIMVKSEESLQGPGGIH